MAIRYEYAEPEFAGCFVEFSEAWSREQWRFYQSDKTTPEEEAKGFALIRSKIIAMRLVTIDGVEITDPAQLTPELLDQLDLRLWLWLSNALAITLSEIPRLGEALGRRLWATRATMTAVTDRPKP